MHPLLGRIPSVSDPRDRDFLMVSHPMFDPTPPPVPVRNWEVPTLYDQGRTPHCVGYSWAGFMSASEYVSESRTLGFDAEAIYAYANAHDGIAGPHDGSTVRAGADTLVSVGVRATSGGVETDFIKPNYYWGDLTQPHHDLDTIATWILTISPVVFGVTWFNDMFNPGADGFVHPTGGEAGGHAILCRGVDTTNKFFTLRNSWGNWGVNGSGDCYVSYDDMEVLLSADGEACAAVDALGATPFHRRPRHHHRWFDRFLHDSDDQSSTVPSTSQLLADGHAAEDELKAA